MRHEECPGSKAKKHHRDRNALLPAHAQANFLLGMAQTSTGVTRPIIVAMVGRSFRELPRSMRNLLKASTQTLKRAPAQLI